MRPFSISDSASELVDPYPTAETLRRIAPLIGQQERRGFLRLFMSEGIPFAFQQKPLFFEQVRDWLSQRLSVDAKSVTLIGSARIGFSLKSSPEYGRGFSRESDLDFAVIDEKLFGRLAMEFEQWKRAFQDGAVAPRNQTERNYWVENSRVVPRNIASGFIDPYMIPNLPAYPTAQRIGSSLWCLKQRLDATQAIPKVKRASLRVYQKWSSFVDRLEINFGNTIASLQREVQAVQPRPAK